MTTIGDKLRLAREARKLTIKQVVQAIRVRAHYLQAIEADNYSAMPSPAQARGFLRIYADFLKIDVSETLNELRPDVPNAQMSERIVQAKSQHAKPEPEPVHEIFPQAGISGNSFQPVETLTQPEIPSDSQLILIEIGDKIRKRRELISITLEEVERHTHIRKQNLEWIEAGEFNKLPSPVQLRGILGTYANFLDLNADQVLLRYADAIQTQRVERSEIVGVSRLPSNTRSISLPAWVRRFVSPDLVFGGAMIIILFGLSIWAAERIFSGENQILVTPTMGPSIADVLLASPDGSQLNLTVQPTSFFEDGTPFPTADEGQIGPSETPVPTISSAVKITVAVIDRTFLRVIVDGVVKLDGRVSPGAALAFDGNSRIEVLTGSGTAIHIIFNEKDLGVMGNFGEVVNRIFTVNGVETPTPTSSPTPTITPIPSVTPRPSVTLRPSSTPRPSSTLRSSSTPRPSLTPKPSP